MNTDEFVPIPRKPKKIKETGRSGVEAAHKADVRRNGGLSLKWVSPGYGGVPDQINLYGVEPMVALMRTTFGVSHPTVTHGQWHELAQALLATAIQFTECKAPGKVPEPHQLRVHERLRARGFTVNVVDTKEPI